MSLDDSHASSSIAKKKANAHLDLKVSIIEFSGATADSTQPLLAGIITVRPIEKARKVGYVLCLRYIARNETDVQLPRYGFVGF